MELLLREDWTAQVERKGQLFARFLTHPAIRAVRACGLLIAVEFESFERNKQIIDACIRRGLLTDWFLFAPECLRIAPPLTITEEQIASACAIILAAVEEN